MPILTREAILSAPIKVTEVEVPEWGGTVRVRELSLKSRILLMDAVAANEAEYQAWKADQDKPEGERQGLERVFLYELPHLTLIYAMVDEDGELLFSIDDYDAIAELDHQTIVNLWVAMKKHETRGVEAEKKRSGPIRKGASPSGSRSRSAKRSTNSTRA